MFYARCDVQRTVRHFVEADDDGGKVLHDCRRERPPVSQYSDWWGKIPHEWKAVEGQQWLVIAFLTNDSSL